MSGLATWQGIVLGLGAVLAAALVTVWWRQQTARWPLVVGVCLVAAPLLSWWSGVAFQVADYRAGCDGLCLGFGGAPVPFHRGETAGGTFLAWRFILNTLVYLNLFLAWSALVRAVLRRIGSLDRPRLGLRLLLGIGLWLAPLTLAPLVLPAPEAHVRGDPQRIAINARRETYLYDQLAPYPVLAVALQDVRPRADAELGMRVCLRMYSFFYLPTGYMYLDMTPEGVHSNQGGVLPLETTCWD